MRVDLGEYEGMKLPTSSFDQITELPAWRERIEPVLDFLSLRYCPVSDDFGQRNSFTAVPEEYHDELGLRALVSQ